MDYRSSVKKKGQHVHSLREREGQDPCLDRLLLFFSEPCIKESPVHLLCTGKDVAVYFLWITKKRMSQIQGEKGSNWLLSIFGRINPDFRKLL